MSMDNNGFEGGEAVLLAARCLPPEAYHGARPEQRGGSREVVLEAEETRREGGLPPVTQANGGPPCHCPSEDDQEMGGVGGLPSKTPTLPIPVVASQSPWHRHKSLFLGVIVVALVVWIVVYTVTSNMELT